MLRIVQVSASFAFAPGATVTFSNTLEVSLDCCICHRCRRTVIFSMGATEGICTPTRHTFPGKLIGKEVGREGLDTFVVYRLEYWYEPFEDAKYPAHRKAGDLPTWGRVGFTMGCPGCGGFHETSTQNNIRRPWAHRCQCGQRLYTETDEMPRLSIVEVTAG